jgi:DNA invertase Pin-like site-specific DNA recombinase
MSDAILSPYLVQNEQIFQEQMLSQIGSNNNGEGMQQTELKHPDVGIYLRCSSDDQTVASQRHSLSNYLMAHGLEIDECSIYIDEGVSAKRYPSFTDRPDGSRLMQDIEKGTIKTVWGFKVDRFFRRVSAGSTFIEYMDDKHPNVTILTQDCQASTHTAAGRMLWQLLLIMAENENEAKSERTEGGMQVKSENLEKTSHSVFGWEEYDSGERNYTQGRDVGALIKMRPCWHEQAVRNWIIENPEGLSANKMASKLNQWNIPTPTGRTWSAGGVRNQAKRPAKLHDQLHQFEQPKKMLPPPFRNFKPAQRF